MINLYFRETSDGMSCPTKLVLADGTEHLYDEEKGRLDYSILDAFKGQEITIHTTREVTESDVWIIDEVKPEVLNSGSMHSLIVSNKAALERQKQREQFREKLKEELTTGSETDEQASKTDEVVEFLAETFLPEEEKGEI
jgi:signal recognition particle receptor subunit beta